MARWILMRHAEAEPAGPADLERRLAPAGHEEARTIARWLAQQGWVPQRVLMSPAVRCRETAQTVMEELGADPEVAVIERLYHGPATDYLDALKRSPAETTLLVAHAPTIGEAVLRLAPGAAVDTAFMSPGAVACIEDGRLVATQRPSELHVRDA